MRYLMTSLLLLFSFAFFIGAKAEEGNSEVLAQLFSAEQWEEIEAQEEQLVDEDQKDQQSNQDELNSAEEGSVEQLRRRRRYPRRPGIHPFYSCYATNEFGRWFVGRSRWVFVAQNRAMRACQFYSHFCIRRGCYRGYY